MNTPFRTQQAFLTVNPSDLLGLGLFFAHVVRATQAMPNTMTLDVTVTRRGQVVSQMSLPVWDGRPDAVTMQAMLPAMHQALRTGDLVVLAAMPASPLVRETSLPCRPLAA